MEGALIPIVVFLIVYVAITLELVNKAVSALLGVMVLLMLHVVPEHEAAALIDFETIMLLLGMMSIVAVLRKSGLFSIISVKIATLTKGSPVKILILFSIVTAVLSAFLDNVTTVLIIIPIIIELTRGMGLDPKIYVISQAITSDHKIVVPTGTAGTVSLCHLNKICVHLFANSLHYSHRDSTHQEIYEEQEETSSANMNFFMTTHSHDLVDLELIDHIITETGEIQKGTYPA